MRGESDELSSDTNRASIDECSPKRTRLADGKTTVKDAPYPDGKGRALAMEGSSTMAAERKEESSEPDNRRFEVQEEGSNHAGGKLSFLEKTWEMIESSPADVAEWSADGKSFVVHDPQRFSAEVIPRFFRHSRFTSFVRQLNFYGFHKVRQAAIKKPVTGGLGGAPSGGSEDKEASEDRDIRGRWEFRHERFVRHNKELMKTILRKTNMRAQAQANIAVSLSGGTGESATHHYATMYDMEKRMHILEDRCRHMQKYLSATSSQLDYVCSFLYESIGRFTPAEKRTLSGLYEQAMMTLKGVRPLLEADMAYGHTTGPSVTYDNVPRAMRASSEPPRDVGRSYRSDLPPVGADKELPVLPVGHERYRTDMYQRLLDPSERRYVEVSPARGSSYYSPARASSPPTSAPFRNHATVAEQSSERTNVAVVDAEVPSMSRKRARHLDDYGGNRVAAAAEGSPPYFDAALRTPKIEMSPEASYFQRYSGLGPGEMGRMSVGETSFTARETPPRQAAKSYPSGTYFYPSQSYPPPSTHLPTLSAARDSPDNVAVHEAMRSASTYRAGGPAGVAPRLTQSSSGTNIAELERLQPAAARGSSSIVPPRLARTSNGDGPSIRGNPPSGGSSFYSYDGPGNNRRN